MALAARTVLPAQLARGAKSELPVRLAPAWRVRLADRAPLVQPVFLARWEPEGPLEKLPWARLVPRAQLARLARKARKARLEKWVLVPLAQPARLARLVPLARKA